MTVTFLDVSDSEKLELQSRRDQDEHFCEAMARAIRDGLEHPPMIGMDTTPGTSRPVTICR